MYDFDDGNNKKQASISYIYAIWCILIGHRCGVRIPNSIRFQEGRYGIFF